MKYFSKGYPGLIQYPLKEKLWLLDSDVVSPTIGDDHGLIRPKMPGDDGFEKELYEVVETRLMVMRNKWPSDLLAKYHPRHGFDPDYIPTPLYRKGIEHAFPSTAALAVQMDSPLDLHISIIAWLNSVDAKLKKPTTKHKNFLDRWPDVLENVADRVKLNLHKAFEAKWFFGRPRPEEVMSISGDIFTAYSEGCPCHPAYPAGHGAAAAAVVRIIEHYELTPDQKDEILDTAYHWAMYRTFAGVHYADDNLAGLWIGGLNYYGDNKVTIR